MIDKPVIAEPEWKLAKCRNKIIDPEIFFPDERMVRPPREVEKICDHCIIQNDCLNWAMATRQVGVWGGTTTKQRQRMLRRVTRMHCPGCRSIDITLYELLDHAVCVSCGVSWAI